MNPHGTLPLIPLYALGCLPRVEEEDVESHLNGCEYCKQELWAYWETMANLVADEPPPRHIWDRIVDQIDSVS